MRSAKHHVVGLNQIATVLNVEYDAYVNVRNYDSIAQYYEQEDNTDEELIISFCYTFFFNIFEKFITHFGRHHEF